MNEAPFPWVMLASWDSGICWPSGVPTSRLPISLGAAAELGLHANHQVEELFSLNHLGDGLSADCGFDHRLHVGDIDAVAGNLVAIDIDQQAGLAQLAHYRQIGKAGHAGEDIFDLHRFVLKDVQIVAIDFDRQRTLEAGQGFVHRVFRGLGVVKDNSGKGAELLVDGCDQLFLVVDLAIPGFVIVGTQADIEFAIEKAGGDRCHRRDVLTRSPPR